MVAYVNVLASTGLYPSVRGAKMCYGAPEQADNMSPSDITIFLKRIIKSGHESVLEHSVLVLEIHGISRACLQELARHRHISLSVKSTRWAMKKHYEYFIPEGINDKKDVYCEYMDKNINLANEIREEFGNDVAKYFLPEGVSTSLVLTVNLRELRHMYSIRTAPNALKEFQDLMHLIVKALHPNIQELVKYNPYQEYLDDLKHTNKFLKNLLNKVYSHLEYDSKLDDWNIVHTCNSVHSFNAVADYIDNNKGCGNDD